MSRDNGGARGSLQRATAADMLCGDLRRLKSDRPQEPGGLPCWVHAGGRAAPVPEPYNPAL